jgi:hypothetical protein
MINAECGRVVRTYTCPAFHELPHQDGRNGVEETAASAG